MSSASHTDLQALQAPSAEPGQLKVMLARVGLEVNTRLQTPSASSMDYMQQVVEAIKRVPHRENADALIGILMDVAQFFYVSGQSFSAMQPVQIVVAIAQEEGLEKQLRKGLTVLGVVNADTGNISGAIECYAKALDIVGRLNDLDAECIVWTNLGVALMYAAQYHEAIGCFDHVIRVVEANPRLRAYRAAAFANIALCSLHLEDFAKGLRAAETSIHESPEPHSAAELVARVLRENNYTRLLLEVNNLEQARVRCEIAKKYASRSMSARAEISASIAEGLYEVQAGNVDIGISRLTSTLEKARLLRSMLRESLTSLVKAYEMIGQPQRALIYLREMIEALRQTQQENALRHVTMHLHNLGYEAEETAPIEKMLQRQEAALKGKVAEQELFRSRIEMLERLAVTAELRDDSTGEHSYRVGKLAALLAQEFGCDDDTCYMIELAARLHDIGKIGVPDAILLKPEKLNEAERQIMRTHTTVGAELLSKSNIPQVQMAEEIARHHHEWWDGSGYPGSLSGTAIPLAARITALADVFDALTHKRPYKIAWPVEAALDEISQLKGRQFEPELTDLFVVLIHRLKGDYRDFDAFLGEAALSSPFLQARSKIWGALRQNQDRDGEGSGSRLDLHR